MSENQSATRQPLAGPLMGKGAFAALLGLLASDPQYAKDMPRREFGPPKLPPGVIPEGRKNCLAMDSDGNAGMYGYLNESPMCGLGFPGYPYLSNLAQRSEYRAPTEVIASEMTREWINFTGVKGSKQKDLEKAFTDFGVRECVRLALEHDGLFGRGQLFVGIKGQDSDKRRARPLLIDDNGAGISKGSLLGFKPIEPIWTTPTFYNSNDPTAPNFYKPEMWYIVGKATHATRLLSFISRPVPDILKPSYNFGGLSLSQLIEPYVLRWLKTVDGVNRLINNFSIINLQTDLLSSLADGGDGGAGLFERMRVFTTMRDNQGLFISDKDRELLESIAVPLSGLSELQAQAQEHMAAPTHIPLVKLTGITPSGLNASSDGEIKVFYDWIGASQANDITPHLRTILKIVQLNLWGKVDPAIGFEYIPLDSPTDKEESEMRKSDGDRDSAYVDRGVLDPVEVRQRLKNDPKSGYTFIDPEAAPVPPDQDNAEHAAGLQEKGKEADAQRGEESAEASARREAEAREHQAELDRDSDKD